MNEPLPPPFGDLTCQSFLFELPEAGERPTPAPAGGTPRLRRAERHQVVFRPLALDALLPPEHEARAVWAYVEGLDLDGFIKHIRAVEGRAGRAGRHPRAGQRRRCLVPTGADAARAPA